MNDLAAETRFEEAEIVHRQLDKVRRARQEYKDTFFSIWKFSYIAVLASNSVSRCKIAFIRQGRVVGFEEYEVDALAAALPPDLERFFSGAMDRSSIDALYDEFCLVANFIVDPLQSVDLLPVSQPEGLPQQVIECLKRRKRKRKPAEDAAPAPEV